MARGNANDRNLDGVPVCMRIPAVLSLTLCAHVPTYGCASVKFTYIVQTGQPRLHRTLTRFVISHRNQEISVRTSRQADAGIGHSDGSYTVSAQVA